MKPSLADRSPFLPFVYLSLPAKKLSKEIFFPSPGCAGQIGFFDSLGSHLNKRSRSGGSFG